MAIKKCERGLRVAKRPSGFTLVEMVIVMILLVIVGGAVASSIGSTLGIWSDVGKYEEERADLDFVLEKISREVRMGEMKNCIYEGKDVLGFTVTCKPDGNLYKITAGGVSTKVFRRQ